MSYIIDLFQTIITYANFMYLMEGLALSVQFALVVIFGSLVLGTVIAIVRSYGPKQLNAIAVCYVELFRNTPLLLWILFARFTLPSVLGVTAYQAVVITFICFCASGLSEVVRGGLKSVGKGQFEAAQSQGFNFFQTLRYIVLPQTLKLITPQLLQTIITIIKDSSYLSTIGIAEFMYNGRVLMAHFFQADQIIFIFGYLAGIYFLVNFSLSLIVRYLTSEKRAERKRAKIEARMQAA